MSLAVSNDFCCPARAPCTNSGQRLRRDAADSWSLRAKGRRGYGSDHHPARSTSQLLRPVLMPADVKAQYAARVAAGEIERDAAQERVLEMLAQLERRLREHRLARKSSSLGWLFGARERREEPIRGL